MKALAVVAALLLWAGVADAGGWYWVWPPPGTVQTIQPNSSWMVAESFDTVAACEAARRKGYSENIDEARRIGATFNDDQRTMLSLILDLARESDPLSRDAYRHLLRETEKDPLLTPIRK